MKFMIARSGEAPKICEEALALNDLQSLVDGYVEAFLRTKTPRKSGGGLVTMYCNEDGQALELRPNRTVAGFAIVGTIVVAGLNGKGEHRSLTEAEVAEAFAALTSPEPG